MRCYSCRKYDNCELSWKCSSTMYDCSAYELEQTNEEWLKQCTTEQLADVLWEKINGAFNSGYACCNLKQDKDYISRYKRFKEWLKQPHT